MYSADTVSDGSLPGLRAGTKPASSSSASAAPRMKPRASAATTKSTSRGCAQSASSPHRMPDRPVVEQQRRDVLEQDPRGREVGDVADQRPQVGIGHLAMRRMSRTSSRCLRCEATAARFSSASTASLRRSGLRERSARGEDLLEQAGLALGRGLEDAQVAPCHAVARQLGDRADDLALGLVVVARRPAHLAGHDPEVLELGHQPPLGARLLDHVLERVQRALVAQRERQPPQRRARPGVGARLWRGDLLGALGAATRRELLADHPQREELVALQAQDRPQPRDVGLRVEPVAAGRPPRRQQLLVLEVADLGDRDVRELLRQRLADRSDRERLLALDGLRLGVCPVGRDRLGSGVRLAHRAKKVSLNLPICSSSPSASRCESTRWRLT